MMALTKCKECKKDVSDMAKKCPHCGISNPGITAGKMAKGCLLLIVLVIVGSFALSKCSDDSSTKPAQPQVEQAFDIKGGVTKSYQIVSEDDYSFSGRKRLRIFIVSTSAQTLEDRASTAQKAAKDYLHQERANQVTVILETSAANAGKGNPLAIATYTPDGCGNSGKQCTGKAWEIEATGEQFKSGKKPPLFTRTVLTK